jgi:hypothetical protein
MKRSPEPLHEITRQRTNFSACRFFEKKQASI